MSKALENLNAERKKSKEEAFRKPEKKHSQAQIVGNSQIKNPKVNPVAVNTHSTPKPNEDAYWPLSGKPYFHLIITKSTISPLFQLYLPKKTNEVLPNADMPMEIYYCGKPWNMCYLGNRVRRRFDSSWKGFAMDNELKVGDACVFEVVECCRTKLIIKAQILRGDFPDELLKKAKGQTSDSPITLD